jgi:hypothetical protein
VNVESNGTDGVVRCCRLGITEIDGGFGAFIVAVRVSGEGFVG